MNRLRFLVPAVVVLVIVAVWGVAAGPSHVSGDEMEYYAMTYAIATHGVPTLTPEVVQAVRSAIPGRPPREPVLVKAPDGTSDALHFWFLPALASPFFIFCRIAGLDWRHCFTLLNAVVCGIAAGIIGRYFRPFTSALLIVCLGTSPVFVYLNKAHPEAFSVMLAAAAAVLLARGLPLMAALSLSVVSAQVSAFSPLAAGLIVYWAFLRWRERRKPSPSELTIVVLCAGLLALQPVWTLMRHHTLNVIIREGYVSPQLATLRRVCAMLFDPDVGLLFVWPLALAAGILTLWGLWKNRDLLIRYRAYWIFAAATIAFLSYAGAQQVNITSSVPRYSLWFIPLFLVSIILVFERQTGRIFSIVILAVLLGGSAWSMTYSYQVTGFQPSLKRRPLAELWYRHFPSWYDPDEQIFVERSTGELHVMGLELFLKGRYPIDVLPDPHLWAVSNQACTKLLVLAYAFTSSNVQPLAPLGCKETLDTGSLLHYARLHGVPEMRDQYVDVPESEIDRLRLASPPPVPEIVPNRKPKVESIEAESDAAHEVTYFIRVSDPDGWQNIDTIFLSVTNPRGGPAVESGCQVVFNQPRDDIRVNVSAADSSAYYGRLAKPAVPGRRGELKGEHCYIDPSRVKVAALGEALTVMLPVSQLDPALTSAGTIIQVGVTDLLQSSSGWVPLEGPVHDATTSIPETTGLTIEKTVKEGNQFIVRLAGSDPGLASLSRFWLIINGQLDPAHGCYILVEPGSRTIYLTPDNGNPEGAIRMSLDSGKSLGNSQCTIDMRDSSLTMKPGNLDIRVSIVKSQAFAGSQHVWAGWQYANGKVESWREIATW